MARYLLLSIRRCQALECAGAATDRIIADIWRAAEPVSLRADQSSSGAAARLAALRSEAMLEQAWSLLAIEVSVASVALKGRSVGPALHLWIDALAPLVDRFETEAVLRR